MIIANINEFKYEISDSFQCIEKIIVRNKQCCIINPGEHILYLGKL